MRRVFGVKRALAAGVAAASIVGAAVATAHGTHHARAADAGTRTPIKHVVVIFQENVSFDHYFGTYPHAANTSGQPVFGHVHAHVNGLYHTPGLNGQGTLLTNNPNTDAGGHQVNPRRLDPANINEC